LKKAVSKLETIVERDAIIKSTAGSLTPEEGEEAARIIEEGCERID